MTSKQPKGFIETFYCRAGMSSLSEDPLEKACNIVGCAASLRFVFPKEKGEAVPEQLAAIVQESNLCMKQVSLQGRWWVREGLPMLGFLAGSPVALVWDKGYMCVDPEGMKKSAASCASQLSPSAYTFFASFSERTGIKDIAKLCWRGNLSSVIHLFLLGSLGALIGLFSPFVYKMLFDTVVPQADHGMLLQILAGLVIVAFSGLTFQIVRSFLILRLEGIFQGRMTAALWDRLLKLPMPFFRRYASGDLIQRASIVEKTREILGGQALQLSVSAFLSLFYLIPMFYFSWQLACAGLAILSLVSALSIIFLFYRIRIQRLVLELGAEINKFLLQIVQGIDKLRVGGATEKAYSLWRDRFFESQQWGYRLGKVQILVTIFSSLLSAVSLLCIYAIVFYLLEHPSGSAFTIGTFMAFNAAFTPFAQAVSGILGALVPLVGLIPNWERGKVILAEPLEVLSDKYALKGITGSLELQKGSFRYDTQSPWIVKNVTLKAAPGEMIGVAGPSGCGKSTLLRLLLGFESLDRGEIYYDDHKIREINLKLLRQKIGAVLQTSGVLAGSIYDNIVCGREASPEQIERAIAISCFDEVLAELPLGFDTPLPSGGLTLSGGQKQRLLLARALICEPAILLLDEATSALDAMTQERVMGRIASLNITRVVVAHNLTTLQKANRIYVMNKGELIEEGAYDELIKNNGLFSQLARRQQL